MTKTGAMTSNTVLKVTVNKYKYTRVCRVALTSGATVVLTPITYRYNVRDSLTLTVAWFSAR